MKKLLPFVPITFFIIIISCGPSVKDALQYNDTIVYYHEDIDRKIAYLSDTYDNYVPREMDTAYTVALNSAQKGIDFVKTFHSFHGDDTYRQAVLKLFEVYKSVIETEHARIIALFKLPTEQYQQAEIEEVEQLKESATNKIQEQIDSVANIQKAFAKKFNFKFNDEENQ